MSPKKLFHASFHPGALTRKEQHRIQQRKSGRTVRFSGTFKALQRARNPPKAYPLSVPEDRTVCPLGAQEAYIAKKIVPQKASRP